MYVCVYMCILIYYEYIYLSFFPESASSFSAIKYCIKNVLTWMIENKLSVNFD